MNILGVIFESELPSAAAIISDGRILAAVQEERLSRIKYTDIFPEKSIEFCFKKSGIAPSEIDFIIYPYSLWLNTLAKIYLGFRLFPDSIFFYLNNRKEFKHNSSKINRHLKNLLSLTIKSKFVSVEHHITHAAGAFFQSPYKEAAIITLDGRGELDSCGLWIGRDNKIFPWKKIRVPHSLGFVYSLFTAFLGFRPGKDESKIMALAAFGQPEYYNEFKKIIKVSSNGGFYLDLDYFDYKNGRLNYPNKTTFFSKKITGIFGYPRIKNTPITTKEYNIAASLQKRLEDIILYMTNYFHQEIKTENLCLSGGIMLNAVMNGKLKENTPFKNIYIQPNPSDAGCSIGGALYYYYKKTSAKRIFLPQTDFFGPDFVDIEIQNTINSFGLNYTYCKDIEKTAAEFLSLNKIVGWFQGKMEFGPRALGNRSILAHPGNLYLKNVLLEIKNRGEFNPFAVTILSEFLREYFNSSSGSPYMQFVYKVCETKKIKIPVVIHIDNSIRVQCIDEQDNPKFRRLINEFYSLTGIPMVLNTSFNRGNEPIVCSPTDAINCYLNSQIDILVLGNYMIKK